MYYGNKGELLKTFFVRDGLGISLARQNGIKLAIITGRKSEIVETRGRELKFNAIYQGQLFKMDAFEALKEQFSLKNDEIAYIGDDLVDLPIMVRVGFAAAVADAVEEVKQNSDMVSDFKGGYGAVRQIIEFILKAQGKWQKIVKDYLEKADSARLFDNKAQ